MFADYRENTNSQVIQETIKSELTAEFRQASKEALITNAYNANPTAIPVAVEIANSSAISVDANITNDAEHPVPTQEITG